MINAELRLIASKYTFEVLTLTATTVANFSNDAFQNGDDVALVEKSASLSESKFAGSLPL
jgi:hypothetical protein